jgi:hypothetical protein
MDMNKRTLGVACALGIWVVALSASTVRAQGASPSIVPVYDVYSGTVLELTVCSLGQDYAPWCAKMVPPGAYYGAWYRMDITTESAPGVMTYTTSTGACGGVHSLFVRGTDGYLWENQACTPVGDPSVNQCFGWERVDTKLAISDAPAPITMWSGIPGFGDDKKFVFARGSDNGVWYREVY